MRDNLKKQIEAHRDAMTAIQEQLDKLDLDKGQYLVGKYIVLAGTCYMRVDKILTVNGNEILAEGVKVTGGKDAASFSIRNEADEYFFFDMKMHEVTKEEFDKFIETSFAYAMGAVNNYLI